MKAIILAAGVGKRIKRQLPKCLIELTAGKTIIENQRAILRASGIREIFVVAGFKKELLMERCPEVVYVYNPNYHITNTSKSLFCAMEQMEEDDVIWLNGDVYLQPQVIELVLSRAGNVIAVNKEECRDEEVKYQTDASDRVVRISKEVCQAEGEAVGINKISKKDFATLAENLRRCDDGDYFEKAIELCIEQGVEFRPADISRFECVEVDFEDDLKKIRAFSD
jgi:choline kinase